jgi:hypothetical protein
LKRTGHGLADALRGISELVRRHVLAREREAEARATR